MIQFFETVIGRMFFEVTVPDLVRQLKRLNDILDNRYAIEKIVEILYPSGDQNYEWKVSDLDDIANILMENGHVKEKS